MDDQLYAPRKRSIPSSSSTNSAPNKVEAMMQKLRNEVLTVTTDLNQAKDSTMRKSITIMENHLVKNNEAFENHLKEVNEKHKHHVENSAKHYEETINNLKWQLQDRDNLVEKLKSRLDDCRTARMEALEELAKTQKQYGQKVKELESCISEGKETMTKVQAELEKMTLEVEKVRILEEAVEDARSYVEALERGKEELENKMEDKEVQVRQLEAIKERLEKSLEALEKENAMLREDLEKYMDLCKNKDESADPVRKMLEDQLSKVQLDWDKTKKELVLEQVRHEKLEAELAEVRKENGLLKVDFRIETREKKELESKIELLEEQNNSNREKLAALEEANHILASKISSSLDEMDSLKLEIKAKEEELQAIVAVKVELIEQKSQLEQDKTALENDVAILKVKAGEVEGMEKVIAQKNELIEAKLNLLQEKDRKIQALQKNVDVLKEVSTLLDSQLSEFQEALDKRLSSLEDAEKMKELLEKENQDLREQLKNCKIELNEAKSLKVFTEKRLEKTENSLKSEYQSKEAEVRETMEKLSMVSERNEELSEELNAMTSQISDLEREKFELRKLLDTGNSDRERMGKEMSTLVNSIVHMKEEVMTLQNAVKESIGKAEKYKGMHESLQEKHNVLISAKNTNEVMFTTRIEQQEKLISYLQEQLNAAQEKKKKKGFIYTPRKGKDASTPAKCFTPSGGFKPTSVPSTPLSCLQREKIAEGEVEREAKSSWSISSSPFARESLSVSQTQPGIVDESTPNRIAIEEGSGKPHRFLEGRCENTQKCVACCDPIYKGRPISKCETCNESFHLACASTAPKTCEMARVELENSGSSFEKATTKLVIREEKEEEFKGWVTIRTEKMRSAEKLFLRIEGSNLSVYGSETARTPLENLPLNEFTTVYFRLEKNFEEKSATLDIAFAMKINFDCEDDQQSAYMYMFHPDKIQKRYWIRGIQKYSKVYLASSANTSFGSELSASSEDNKESNPAVIKVNETVLLEDGHDGKIYVNCIYLLPNSQIYLLGCDDGLYSLKAPGAALVKIEGPQVVYQIDTLAAAKTAVFIEGPGQILSTAYLGLLKTCAEAAECSSPKLTTQTIPRTNGSYMFTTRGNSLKDTIVAAAASDLLLICAWYGQNGLKLVKEIKVGESITSLLMTPHTVIYGNHSVFEVDTKSFEIEPFLDSTDEAVSYIQLLNESHGSYPIAILDVTQSRGGGQASEPEFLICFQDIGIFVDGFGTRSRDGDLLWSHAPIAFEYRHPFLYIFHFTSIEIQKLDEKSYTRVHSINKCKEKSGEIKETVVSRLISPPTRFLTVSLKTAPSYVGKSKDGVVIFLNDNHCTKVSDITPVS